jgi:hypothetical protein
MTSLALDAPTLLVQARGRARNRQSRWFFLSMALLMAAGWSLVGDKDPDGSVRKPREGIFTWIVTKLSGHWQIRAAQNTNLSYLPLPTVQK